MVYLRSTAEIDKIRHSSHIAREALMLMDQLIKPGITSHELDEAAEKFIRSEGGEPGFKGLYGYPACLCVSIDEVVVHGIPNDQPLKAGQIVGIDVGVLKNGYYGDHARSWPVGEIDSEKQLLLQRTRECLKLGIAAAVEGGFIGDIGFAVQQHAESFGYGIVRELVGHGIGSRLHEEPQIPNYGERGRGTRLQAGMCLALEPMINMGTEEVETQTDGWTVTTLDGKPSAHFEHTIALTEHGTEILTDYETD